MKMKTRLLVSFIGMVLVALLTVGCSGSGSTVGSVEGLPEAIAEVGFNVTEPEPAVFTQEDLDAAYEVGYEGGLSEAVTVTEVVTEVLYIEVPGEVIYEIVEATDLPTIDLPADLASLPVDDAPVLWDNIGSSDWNYVFRNAVSSNGQAARFRIVFGADFEHVTIPKMSVDDLLTLAVYVVPGGEVYNITESFHLNKIQAGGTGDPALDEVLETRWLNLTDGEDLPHITEAVYFGFVKEGSYIEFFIKDDVDQGVNRGLGLIMFFVPPDQVPGGLAFMVDRFGEPMSE